MIMTEKIMINNYYELLKNKAEYYPQKVFLQVEENAYTYESVLSMVDKLADKFLQKRENISQGEAVLITGEGFLQQAGAFLALQKLGAIPIIMHHGFSEKEIWEIIIKNSLQGWWCLDDDGHFEKSDLPVNIHQEKDIMGVLTSGSTGIPKILYRTYFSWGGFFEEQNRVFHIDENSVIFIHGSLSFTGNLNILAGMLFAGGSVVTSHQLNGRKWQKLIRKYNVNCLYMVPAKLQILAESGKDEYNEMKHIITGSQLVSEVCRNGLYNAFPNAKLILYYGASELNYITYRILRKNSELELENLGKPFRGIEIIIRDDVIYVDTPYHVSGVEIPFTCEDTGYINENDDLIFLGRKTQWINKGGYKVSCLKLENKIKALPDVANAVVLSCEDKLRGQEAAAFIVLSNTDNLTREEFEEKKHNCRQLIRQNFDTKEIPKIIKFISEITLNDRGKTDKEALLCII